MKADAIGWKIARRSAVIAVSACCLALLTGCPWDEDEDTIPPIPTQWEVSWNPDPSNLSPQTIVVPWDDLTAAESVDEMIDVNGVTYHVTLNPGPPIVIVIDDISSQAKLVLTSTATAADQANGDYDGTDPTGNSFSGIWMVVKK